MVGLSLEVNLLIISITISLLVLMGQRQASIRESIEQLDDRDLDSNQFKVRAILHEVRFFYGILPKITSPKKTLGNIHTIVGSLWPPENPIETIWTPLWPPWRASIAFRLGKKGPYSGLSTPLDITKLSEEIEKEVMSNEQVSDAYISSYSELTSGYGMEGDDSVEEEHKEIIVTIRSINPVLCRKVADRVMSRIRALDRLR